VFGFSFSELLVVVVVGLIVLGPQKLPGLFRSIGQWINQLRRLTTEVRAQSGIDEILRTEGLQGGLSELRGLMRSDYRRGPPIAGEASGTFGQDHNPYAVGSFEYDVDRERPVEGPDSYDALAEDLTSPMTTNAHTSQ
jgi:sec-independent protein translocase protein TatB